MTHTSPVHVERPQSRPVLFELCNIVEKPPHAKLCPPTVQAWQELVRRGGGFLILSTSALIAFWLGANCERTSQHASLGTSNMKGSLSLYGRPKGDSSVPPGIPGAQASQEGS